MTNSPDAHDRVTLAVSLVPPRFVATYGDIGAIAGVGPRQVGSILKRTEVEVPWWRIVGHSGVLVPLASARPHWEAEGIQVRPDGRGCQIRRYRTDLAELATEYLLAASERGWQINH